MRDKDDRSRVNRVDRARQELARTQMRIIELFGTIDYDPDYDYKALRRKKRGSSL